jgi:hypothetical protein
MRTTPGPHRRLIRGLLIVILVTSSGMIAGAAGEEDEPLGWLDEVVSADPGRILVRGWAADGSNPDAQVMIGVTTLGPDGAVRRYDVGPATRHRPDVGRVVFPDASSGSACLVTCAANLHGFAAVLTDQLPGVHQVCVDASIAGGTRRLGCQLQRVAWASMHDPHGEVVSVEVAAGPAVVVRGWAVDGDNPAEPVTVRAYALQRSPWSSAYLGVDLDPCLLGPMSCVPQNPNNARTPTPGMETTADEPLPDPARGYAGTGFTKVVDRQEFTTIGGSGQPLDPRLPTRVCVFAENKGPGRDAVLGCQWVTLG